MITKPHFNIEEHIYTQNFFIKEEAESFTLPHGQAKKWGRGGGDENQSLKNSQNCI